jgi:hypothetical protein
MVRSTTNVNALQCRSRLGGESQATGLRSQVMKWSVSIHAMCGKVRFAISRVFQVLSIVLCSVICTFCARPIAHSSRTASVELMAEPFSTSNARSNRHRQPATGNRQRFFPSEAYNHFEGGKLFTDVQEGLDVMWKASFRYGKPYKENLGFILPHGILVAPNKDNTRSTAAISVYPKWVEYGKLLLLYNGNIYEVLAIVHTHPQPVLQEPTPLYDFQYCFMGIHNFVISRQHIFDAWKDKDGNETFRILGKRTEYERIVGAMRNEIVRGR